MISVVKTWNYEKEEDEEDKKDVFFKCRKNSRSKLLQTLPNTRRGDKK